MKYIVVCDTNIYISAFVSAAGVPDEVLTLARRKEIEVAISPVIKLEIEKVLRDKLLLQESSLHALLREIGNFTRLVKPKVRISLIKEKDSDNRILECALEVKADYIVSGDTKHLQPLKEFQGIPILSPAQFLVAISRE